MLHPGHHGQAQGALPDTINLSSRDTVLHEQYRDFPLQPH